MTTTYIYALVDPRDNAIRYVGKTVDIKNRLAQHMSDGSGSKEKREWVESLRSISLFPEVRILAVVNSDNCFTEEKSWIKKMIDDGCDLVNGNMGRGGTETTKKRNRKPLIAVPVRFTEDELLQLDELKERLGVESRNQVIRWLLSAAHVRQASVKFAQPTAQN